MKWRIDSFFGLPSENNPNVVPLKQAELDFAFKRWNHFYEEICNYKWPQDHRPDSSQILNARVRLALPAKEISTRLKVTPQAYRQLEDDEASATITLEQMQKIAQAMDCEFFYEIRPKNGKSFAKHIWDILLPVAKTHHWLARCDPNRRGDALAAIARDLMLHHKIRKTFGWTRNRQ